MTTYWHTHCENHSILFENKQCLCRGGLTTSSFSPAPVKTTDLEKIPFCNMKNWTFFLSATAAISEVQEKINLVVAFKNRKFFFFFSGEKLFYMIIPPETKPKRKEEKKYLFVIRFLFSIHSFLRSEIDGMGFLCTMYNTQIKKNKNMLIFLRNTRRYLLRNTFHKN